MKFITLVLIFLLFSCGVNNREESKVKLRPLNTVESLADFDTLVGDFRALYGPLEYKEKRFNFNFDELVASTRKKIAASKNDAELMSLLKKFVATFRDGHLSLYLPRETNSTGIFRYTIDAVVAPIEGRAIMVKISDVLKNRKVSKGDELISVDGKDPFSYLDTIKKYESLGNDVSDKHLIATVLKRPFYMLELLPKKDTVDLVFKKPDGKIIETSILWEVEKTGLAETELVTDVTNPIFMVPNTNNFNSTVAGTLLEMGAPKPYFLTEATRNKFKITRVFLDDAFYKKYNVKKEKLNIKKEFLIQAYHYVYEGKHILLLRQPSYIPENRDFKAMLSGYKAILDQEAPFTDVLIVDQNNNPGGYGEYAINFFSLFIDKVSDGFVMEHNADRKWLNQYLEAYKAMADIQNNLGINTRGYAEVFFLRAKEIEKSIDEGLSVTKPMPMGESEVVKPDREFTWKKPMLVLANELSGSSGDIFPMLIRNNGVAKIMGMRTMGLGGNVEPTSILPNLRARVNMTRGLFMTYKKSGVYELSDYVENNGIKPDYEIKLTVDDYRAGFTGYLEEVSKKAISQIPEKTIDEQPSVFNSGL